MSSKVTIFSAPELAPVSEEYAREFTDEWIDPRWSGSGLRIHLPDPTTDEPRPLCMDDDREYRSVDVAVFPAGYRPVCRSCRLAISMQMDDPPVRDEPLECTKPAMDTCSSCGGPKRGDDCTFCQDWVEVFGE